MFSWEAFLRSEELNKKAYFENKEILHTLHWGYLQNGRKKVKNRANRCNTDNKSFHWNLTDSLNMKKYIILNWRKQRSTRWSYFNISYNIIYLKRETKLVARILVFRYFVYLPRFFFYSSTLQLHFTWCYYRPEKNNPGPSFFLLSYLVNYFLNTVNYSAERNLTPRGL